MTQQHKRQSETKMVPVPSHSIVPERDVDKRPVLETRHLGVEFGGLKAVEDFNLTIGRTEIAGLIGPTARANPPPSTPSRACSSPAAAPSPSRAETCWA